jgi:hypothetical protein
VNIAAVNLLVIAVDVVVVIVVKVYGVAIVAKTQTGRAWSTRGSSCRPTTH